MSETLGFQTAVEDARVTPLRDEAALMMRAGVIIEQAYKLAAIDAKKDGYETDKPYTDFYAGESLSEKAAKLTGEPWGVIIFRAHGAYGGRFSPLSEVEFYPFLCGYYAALIALAEQTSQPVTPQPFRDPKAAALYQFQGGAL